MADFSRRICAEVYVHVPERVEVSHCDILAPPKEWFGRFDVVCADTLVNRFDQTEFERFVDSCHHILAEEGRLRTIVKIGLYEMDRKLLDVARDYDSTVDFWGPSL